MKGYFQGMKKTNISTPHAPLFKETGRYLTPRYGWLSYFTLLVPESAEVKSICSDKKTYYIVRMPFGETYHFKIIHGDAETPDIGYMNYTNLNYINFIDLEKLEKEFPIAVGVYEVLEKHGIDDQQLSIFIPYFMAYILINSNENLVDAVEELETKFVEKTIFMLRKYYSH
ncbi:MAG: hypothetical protein QXW42_04320 [Thermofilum sp.]